MALTMRNPNEPCSGQPVRVRATVCDGQLILDKSAEPRAGEIHTPSRMTVYDNGHMVMVEVHDDEISELATSLLSFRDDAPRAMLSGVTDEFLVE